MSTYQKVNLLLAHPYVSDLIDSIQLFKEEMWKSSLTPLCLLPSTFTWIPNTIISLRYFLHLSYPLQLLMQNFSHLDYNAIITKLCCFLFYSIFLTIPRVVLIKAKPATPPVGFQQGTYFKQFIIILFGLCFFFFFNYYFSPALLFDQNLSNLKWPAQLKIYIWEITEHSLVNPAGNCSPWNALNHFAEVWHSAWVL